MLAHETPNFAKVTNNPWAIEVAMNSRGLTTDELAEQSGIPVKQIENLINGEIEAEIDEIRRIGMVLNYPDKFFQQWFESQIEWGGKNQMSRSVPIKYEDYKIMGVVKPPKKILFIPSYLKKEGLLF